MSTHNYSADPDSVPSTPLSDHPPPPPARWHQEDYYISGGGGGGAPPEVRLMCSYGGRILPRPQDHQLRYVGGDTRIVAVPRSTHYSALLSKLSKLSGLPAPAVKYQLPHEDLDSLISLTSDEDLELMLEEYDRLQSSRNPRLRVFLFPPSSSGFGSIFDGPRQSQHDRWFLDALNRSGSDAASGHHLERFRSEASSIMSEVPDYLFGFDANSDEPKPKTQTISDPGSPPAALLSPQYPSVSSSPSIPYIPDLPPVRTKPEDLVAVEPPPVQNQTGFGSNPVYYMQEPAPFYYVSGGSLPVRPVNVPVPVQYHPVGQVVSGQLPVGYGPPPLQVNPGAVYMGPQIGRPVMHGSYEYVFPQRPQVPAPGGLVRSPGVQVDQTAGIPLMGGAEPPAIAGHEIRFARSSQ